jgi:cytochrome c oxidase cbb3-type subunit 3
MGERTPAPGAVAGGVRQIPLRPGVPTPDPEVKNPYAGDTRALADGGRLYNWMNCSGCHFEGGGGIGPPLMDDDWIYGGRSDQIFDTIVNGRANGMPAYGGKLAADQIWHIVAHVESLSGSNDDDRK